MAEGPAEQPPPVVQQLPSPNFTGFKAPPPSVLASTSRVQQHGAAPSESAASECCCCGGGAPFMAASPPANCEVPRPSMAASLAGIIPPAAARGHGDDVASTTSHLGMPEAVPGEEMLSAWEAGWFKGAGRGTDPDVGHLVQAWTARWSQLTLRTQEEFREGKGFGKMDTRHRQ